MGAPNFIAGGLLQGWREGQQDFNTQQRMDEDRKLNEQRIANEQTQNAIQQHQLDRMPTLDTQHDQAFGLEQALGGQRQKLGQHTLDRQPTLDTQEDQSFETGQRLKNAQINAAGQEAGLRGQESSLRAIQIQQQKLGLSDSMLAHATQQNQRILAGAYQDATQTGDYQKFVDAYNSTVGHTIGHSITGLKQNDDGSFTAEQEGGKPMNFQNGQELLNGALSMNDPSLMVSSLYAQHQAAAEAAKERAKDPKKFSELIRDENGQLGNYDLGTNKFSPLTDADGNPLRGTVAGKAREGVATDAAEAFYQHQVAGGASQPQALAATQQYMKTFHPGVKGTWQQGPQPQQNGVGAAVAQGNPQQPQAQPAVPPAAIQMLRQNPNLRAAFDQKYGQGASSQYLNN